MVKGLGGGARARSSLSSQTWDMVPVLHWVWAMDCSCTSVHIISPEH